MAESDHLPTWFRNPLNKRVTTKAGFFKHNPYWEAQPLGKNHVMVKITFAYEHFQKHDVDRFITLFFEDGYNEVVDHVIKGPKGSRRELVRRKDDKKALLFTPLGMTCPEPEVTRNKDGKFEKLIKLNKIRTNLYICQLSVSSPALQRKYNLDQLPPGSSSEKDSRLARSIPGGKECRYRCQATSSHPSDRRR